MSTRSMIFSTSTRSMIFSTSTRSINFVHVHPVDDGVDVDAVEKGVDVDRLQHQVDHAIGHGLSQLLHAIRPRAPESPERDPGRYLHPDSFSSPGHPARDGG